MTQFETPIAFLVFNRPETTARVFEVIRSIRPRELLLVVDGPRDNHPGDAAKCAAVRALIDKVDWPCTVLRNYSDTNLGCKNRVSSGLDWVFEQVDEAIILEDDCLPDPSFFVFCSELLEKYREDRRVMMISGDNFLPGAKRTPYSYYFSMYPHIWGWATWRRAWQLYDVRMSLLPEIMSCGFLNDIFRRAKVIQFWEKMFLKTFDGKYDTWDHQLTFACIVNNGLCILPDRNLVENIGFGGDATHTKEINKLANMPVLSMDFPLIHPPYVIRDLKADTLTENEQFNSQQILLRIIAKIYRFYNEM